VEKKMSENSIFRERNLCPLAMAKIVNPRKYGGRKDF